jgi:predicted DNA-binding transcriptional regulator AlpA
MQLSIPDKPLVTEKQIVGLCGLSASKLRVYRTARHNDGKVPKSIKIKGRVYYRAEDLVDWIKAQGLEV